MPTPPLSVVIPTRDRRAKLLETLSRLGAQARDHGAEVVVVDDGSNDGTADALGALGQRYPAPLRVERLPLSRGPGAARNRGIGVARGDLLLFLGDDIRPREGMVARHLAFHRERPDASSALLGRIVPAPAADDELSTWLHEEGKQFAFARMSPDHEVPPRLFQAANSSLKATLLRGAGGFDERFRFGHEELELSIRLERAGLRLAYDPEALAEHDHPTDLVATLARMREFGRSYRLLTEIVPGEPAPRRPGLRHRAKGAALTAVSFTARRSPRVRRMTWRFLCEEAHREGYWGEPDPEAGPPVRVGRLLAGRAAGGRAA